MKWLWLTLLAVLVPAGALAHRASDSFLALAETGDGTLEGHWDVALDDLHYALGLDDGDGDLRWGELRAREGEVVELARSGLRFTRAGAACALRSQPLALVRLSDGLYARVPFLLRCAGGDAHIALSESLLAEVDRDHRVLVRVGQGAQARSQVLGRSQPALTLAQSDQASAHATALRAAAAQIARGLRHIFEGSDHIAFLLVLLLPAVFRRHEQLAGLRPLALEIAKVVTAFTLAHSLTLSLAALGFLRTSADVIEPAIAASVALAALSNLWPQLFQHGYLLAFALGLLHGFGFSSALADAGLSGAALFAALFGFNLGVELGQLLIVALFVPLALLASRVRSVRSYALPCGSLAVFALALFWVFERLQTG
jgi:hypothetical protein